MVVVYIFICSLVNLVIGVKGVSGSIFGICKYSFVVREKCILDEFVCLFLVGSFELEIFSLGERISFNVDFKSDNNEVD